MARWKPLFNNYCSWLMVVLIVTVLFQTATGLAEKSSSDKECKPGSKPFDKSKQLGGAHIEKSIERWKGYLLIVAFGLFGLFISIVFRALRRCLYDDGPLLDTYFDGGGDINFALLALAIVARWFWTSGFTWSSASVYEFGLAGQFWHAAAGAAVLLLFTMAAFEIRLKAPGAKTFLQVVNARYGSGPHMVLIVFALTLNLIIGGAILMEASRILNSIHQDTNTTSICAVLALAVAVSTVVGGVGGSVYVSYFTSILISGVSLVYVVHTFKDQVDDDKVHERWGNGNKIFLDTCVLSASNKTKEGSLMTFHSRYALMEGVLILLCGITNVFVNQAFWTGAVISRPLHTVWGYLFGAVAWFSLPFMLALSFGFAYWSLASEAGKHLISPDQAKFGYMAVFASQNLLGDIGDYLFYSLTVAATVSSCSAEVLSITAILIYDIYQAYIGPKLSSDQATCPNSQGTLIRYWYHLREIDYMKYFMVVGVSFIIFAIAILFIAIDIDLPWIYKFLGVICGSAVFPIIASVGYFRARAIGIFLGPILGMVCGVVTWLVYASSFPGGLSKFRKNTGRQEVFIAAAAMSVGTGALTTVIMSIFCGACNPSLNRVSTWAKTRLIDNPLRPWATRYTGGYDKAPDFCTLRAILRPAELSAYFMGIILTVLVLIVWPALMLIAEYFSRDEFLGWIWVAIIWGGVAAGFLAIIAALLWLTEVCCNGTCQGVSVDDVVSTISDDAVSMHSHKYLTGVRHRSRALERVLTQPSSTEIISAHAPVPHRYVTRVVEPVSTYVPLPVQGLRTSVDYIQPVPRFQNDHYHNYSVQPDLPESEINYQLSRAQGFKTTINLDN